MTPPPRKRAAKKTTPARTSPETVAPTKEAKGADQSDATPSAEEVPLVVAPLGSATRTPPPEPAPVDPATLVDNSVDKGFCDNHPDRPAVLVTNFTWSTPQRFCASCVPPQYRFLL